MKKRRKNPLRATVRWYGVALHPILGEDIALFQKYNKNNSTEFHLCGNRTCNNLAQFKVTGRSSIGWWMRQQEDSFKRWNYANVCSKECFYKALLILKMSTALTPKEFDKYINSDKETK